MGKDAEAVVCRESCQIDCNVDTELTRQQRRFTI